MLAALAAIICFIGGPLRMFYAAVFEEGAPKPVRAVWTTGARCPCTATICTTRATPCVTTAARASRSAVGAASEHGGVGESAQRH